MLLRILVCLLAMTLCAPTWADDLTSEKRSDLHKLISLSGGFKRLALDVFVDQCLARYQASHRGLHEQHLPALKSELRTIYDEQINGPDGIVDGLLVPIYSRYLTHPEVGQLLQFFGTPIGQKLAGMSGNIAMEIAMAGQMWDQMQWPNTVARLDQVVRGTSK